MEKYIYIRNIIYFIFIIFLWNWIWNSQHGVMPRLKLTYLSTDKKHCGLCDTFAIRAWKPLTFNQPVHPKLLNWSNWCYARQTSLIVQMIYQKITFTFHKNMKLCTLVQFEALNILQRWSHRKKTKWWPWRPFYLQP